MLNSFIKIPCAEKLLCMGRFANKLFEKLTSSVKEDSMDELDHSEKKTMYRIPTTLESYSEDMEYFITKFGNCTNSQIYLVIVNFVFQIEFMALLH